MLTGTPPGDKGLGTKTGWVNRKVFMDILTYLQRFAEAAKEAPSLLILEKNESHITIDFLEFLKSKDKFQ